MNDGTKSVILYRHTALENVFVVVRDEFYSFRYSFSQNTRLTVYFFSLPLSLSLFFRFLKLSKHESIHTECDTQQCDCVNYTHCLQCHILRQHAHTQSIPLTLLFLLSFLLFSFLLSLFVLVRARACKTAPNAKV